MSSKRPHLRLVQPPEQQRLERELESWLVSSAPDPLPDDEHLISKLEGAPPLALWQIRESIEGLVETGRLYRVQIGNRRHLTRTGESWDPRREEEVFRLEVELDVEAEKQLLLKTALVLELIFLALLCREMALSIFGS